MNARLTTLFALVVLASCGKTSATGDAGPFDSGVVIFDAGQPDAGRPPVDAGVPDAGPKPMLAITQVLPPRGSSAGGTQVTLVGSGFLAGFATTGSEAKPSTIIKFKSNEVLDFEIIDDGTIALTAPPGVAGTATITITNPNGASLCNSCFTYFDDLVVTGLSPTQGPLAGGSEVIITGQGFTTGTQVLFGTRSSPKVTFVSAAQVKAVAPRGAQADLVDVVVYDKSGVSTQRRAFQYVADLRVSAVAPLVGPQAGGTTVVLTGQGFTGATQVSFGSNPAASFTVDGDTQVTAVTPAASAAGAVDLTLVTPGDRQVVKNAFTYVAAGGGFAVYGLFPHVVSAGDTVTLTGQALDQAPLSVSIGGVVATVGAVTANTATLTVPPRGAAPRKSDVAVTSSGTATLTGGATWRIGLMSMTPSTGPTAGGTPATVTATALPAQVDAFVGAMSAASPSVTGETLLTFATPAGSGGAPSDLRVRESADPENEAVLPAAFTFLEPLSIGRVQPDRGAVAGGTLVTVLGSGFGASTVVDFGTARAKDLKVIDSHTLTCRTPKAAVGVVDVTVQRLTETDRLPGGFSYFDPRSISGGLSGGPLVGTINVTVLDGDQQNYGAPVPLVNVMLGTDPTTPFQGVTDQRGQLTLSDPSLVKAQTVTVWKDGFSSTTVTNVNAENLTVFVTVTGGASGPPGPPPPGTPASVISGRVTGFKSPRPLAAGEILEARVFVAAGSLFSGPPLGGLPNKSQETWRLTNDGDAYRVYSGAGLRAVYAVLGIWNASAMRFQPLTMGVRRGVTTSPDDPATGEDIVLDMQLDQSAPITIDSPVSFPGTTGAPQPASNGLYSWLDLGAEGFIPNPNNWDTGLASSTSVVSSGTSLTEPNLPALDGSNFIFLDEASSQTGYPVSYYFRRQPGDLHAGVTIGPLLPAPNLIAPTTTFTGTIAWTLDPGGVPDIHDVQLLKPTPFGNVTLWEVVLPGTQNQVSLPQPVVQQLLQNEAGNSLFIVIYSSRSPKFAYNQWTYNSLSGVTWSAFTIAVSNSFTP